MLGRSEEGGLTLEEWKVQLMKSLSGETVQESPGDLKDETPGFKCILCKDTGKVYDDIILMNFPCTCKG